MASSSTAASSFLDPSQQSLQEREVFLLAWTVNSCSNNSVISLEEGWDILDRYGIKVIQRFLGGNSPAEEREKPMGTKGFTSLYTISYKLSTTVTVDLTDYSKDLYDRCKDSVEKFVRTDIVDKLPLTGGIEFLKQFADGWTKHKLLTNWMWRLFMNLDKTVVKTEMLPTITSCYLKCYYDLVFLVHIDNIKRSLLDCAALARGGSLLESSVLKEVIEVFMVMGVVCTTDSLFNLEETLNKPFELHVYRTHFECILIDETSKYYRLQSKSLWNDVDSVTDFAEYLLDTVESIQREEMLADSCLHSTTKQKLVKACLTELVVSTSRTITFYNQLVFRVLKGSVSIKSLTLSESHKALLKRMHYLYQLTYSQHPENSVFNFFDDCSAEFNAYMISLGDQIIAIRSQQQIEMSKQQALRPSTASTPFSSTPSLPPQSFSKRSTETPSSQHLKSTPQSSTRNSIPKDNEEQNEDSVLMSITTDSTSETAQDAEILPTPNAKKSSISSITPSTSTKPSSCAADVDTEFVENSLRLYEHGTYIVNTLFSKHPSFVKALKDGINAFVNRDSTSASLSAHEAAEEEGRESVRTLIRRHRKRMIGSSRHVGTKYSKNNELEEAEEGEKEAGSDSSDSELDDFMRDESPESASRPSKMPRRVSWAGGARQLDDAMDASAGSSSSSSATKSDVSPPPSSSSSAAASSALSSSSSSALTPSSPCPVAASQVAMLASYCDKLLKGGMKQDGDALDSTLERCVQLFGHMSDKDLFAQLYRDALSKRLLNKRSKSNDAERAVITRMRAECGGAYTSKLEGMLNDFMLAEVMNKEFEPDFIAWRAKRENHIVEGISFGVQVLSSGHWPTQKQKEAILPPELGACRTFFSDWYGNVHSHRSLKWVLTLGEAVMCAHYGSRSYDLQVSTLQAVVLRVFHNTDSSMSFSAVQQLTGIADAEVLKRLLHSLSCQKFKILLKYPAGKSVSPSDSFCSNQEFSNALKKDVEPVLKNIEIERGTTIDAAIVRIMKARKVCSHVQLVGEILQQLSLFTPDPKLIKQRIEMLIEKEYLRRDSTDNKSYHYMP